MKDIFWLIIILVVFTLIFDVEVELVKKNATREATAVLQEPREIREFKVEEEEEERRYTTH